MFHERVGRMNDIKVEKIQLTLQKTKILKDISMEFESGKIHGLIGRNGSGKTMLMKCICGFVRPTSGNIYVRGKKVGKDMDFPEDMGIIIETPGFIPYYSGYKNLSILAGLNRKIKKDEVKEAMRTVGLEPDLKRHVGKYSLGMRQRLGIAQAVMEHPSILILDEPMNGLDKDGVKEIRELFLKWKDEGKTMLIASHGAEDIDILCDDVWEMDKGVAVKIR